MSDIINKYKIEKDPPYLWKATNSEKKKWGGSSL